jgi:hypothetical protein
MPQSLTGGRVTTSTHEQRHEDTSVSLLSIHTVDVWIHIIHRQTHDEFAELAALYEDDTCPPCMDMSSAAMLRPF